MRYGMICYDLYMIRQNGILPNTPLLPLLPAGGAWRAQPDITWNDIIPYNKIRYRPIPLSPPSSPAGRAWRAKPDIIRYDIVWHDTISYHTIPSDTPLLPSHPLVVYTWRAKPDIIRYEKNILIADNDVIRVWWIKYDTVIYPSSPLSPAGRAWREKPDTIWHVKKRNEKAMARNKKTWYAVIWYYNKVRYRPISLFSPLTRWSCMACKARYDIIR